MWRNFNNPFQKYVESGYTHKKSEKKSLFFIRISEGLFLAAVLTGLLTGLFVASAQELFSRDGELGGVEALFVFIPMPIFAAFFVSMGFRRRHINRRMIGIAYLTLIIPLLGIGMGGANVLQQIIGGSLGGAFWGFVLSITSKKP